MVLPALLRGDARRRVVLATNVAETSLTVPGIKYVVDPGTARISRYSHRSKVQRLPIEPISQASANQRKGRCGRTSDGICIRLYSEEEFAKRPAFTDPELLREKNVRGHIGVVITLHGCHAFPDARAGSDYDGVAVSVGLEMPPSALGKKHTLSTMLRPSSRWPGLVITPLQRSRS